MDKVKDNADVAHPNLEDGNGDGDGKEPCIKYRGRIHFDTTNSSIFTADCTLFGEPKKRKNQWVIRFDEVPADSFPIDFQLSAADFDDRRAELHVLKERIAFPWVPDDSMTVECAMQHYGHQSFKPVEFDCLAQAETLDR